MGLYNLIHGRNPAADFLLGLLNLTTDDVGRFRDAWVNKSDEGEFEVAVYTRNGGGNREHWDDERTEGADCGCTGCTIEYRLPQHPLYLRDQDDDFDSTYATVFFRVPDEALPMVADLAENRDPSAKWLEALNALREGRRTDVEEKLRPLIEAVAKVVG